MRAFRFRFRPNKSFAFAFAFASAFELLVTFPLPSPSTPAITLPPCLSDKPSDPSPPGSGNSPLSSAGSLQSLSLSRPTPRWRHRPSPSDEPSRAPSFVPTSLPMMSGTPLTQTRSGPCTSQYAKSIPHHAPVLGLVPSPKLPPTMLEKRLVDFSLLGSSHLRSPPFALFTFSSIGIRLLHLARTSMSSWLVLEVCVPCNRLLTLGWRANVQAKAQTSYLASKDDEVDVAFDSSPRAPPSPSFNSSPFLAYRHHVWLG